MMGEKPTWIEQKIIGWSEKKFEEGVKSGLPWQNTMVLEVIKNDFRYKLLRTVDISIFFIISLMMKNTEDAVDKTWMFQAIITNIYRDIWIFFDTRLRIPQLEELANEAKRIVVETMAADPEFHTVTYLDGKIMELNKWILERTIYVDQIPEDKKIPRHHIGRETFGLIWALIHQPKVLQRSFWVKSNEKEPIDITIDIPSCQEDQDITNSKKRRLDNSSCLTQEGIRTNEG